MLSEYQSLNDSHNVLLVIGVTVSQSFEDTGFDEALLIQTFLIPEDFQCNEFFFLVVPRFEYLTERTLADALVDFEPIRDLIVDLADILALVVVKSPVFRAVGSLHFSILSLLQV